ncbi:MAG TPA: sigma-70 family RNA polymerase sigma factor [Anaeromyxobacteraceae bacterium]|nr:sigma-70 family RNA polymerase sigma factor [Anaeromyxobacteraceae bacterium]
MSIEERVQGLLQAGDVAGAATAALEELGPSVLGYLRSVLRDEDDAADAFSQFAENVWKGLPTFRFGSSLKTWAYRVAWYAALNLRNEAWRRRGRPFATGEASALAESIRTKTVVRVARQKDALDRLRESLSVEDQSLLVLRVDQGLSWTEVAEILADQGEPVQPLTLMKRFERLKDRLAKMARDQGLVE